MRSRRCTLRTFVIAGIVAAITLITGLVAAPAATACSLSSHCYGIADWDPSGTYTGGLAYITETRISNLGSSDDFVTAELWVVDSAANLKWVEQGIISGRGGTARWFWADSCGLGSFSVHYPSLSISAGATYATKISYNSGGKWAVYRDGNFVNNSSTCHGSTADLMQAGTESTHNSNVVSGTATTLQKRGSDNTTWSYNWGSAVISADSPVTASWITQYASVQFSEN